MEDVLAILGIAIVAIALVMIDNIKQNNPKRTDYPIWLISIGAVIAAIGIVMILN